MPHSMNDSSERVPCGDFSTEIDQLDRYVVVIVKHFNRASHTGDSEKVAPVGSLDGCIAEHDSPLSPQRFAHVVDQGTNDAHACEESREVGTGSDGISHEVRLQHDPHARFNDSTQRVPLCRTKMWL